ncbi:hypothetical protein HanXRQr2_Chr15g0684621 [Helianthus annuus]|uniref:Uncharacterized protein n=1 Tax=Helianthus annuus TaxID=4232 RepID=A0A9K3H2K5_HELAN|nr:hypothetical protein HanXRQr2_Chr15g0684621 [Helianthus annuus]KAJ0450564.1 hypothetical protein HanHA300_Chr15g0557721 [Helianthus annuus]KAJ0472416.1 hypothetical protein HanHA89_Chr15g0606831 [Helianthus annuus]KAJ0648017.1 hypothetical protein HanLR1_Chr15g0568191 [Helianthus annuus]KAJ0651865.1 hypothetical protein HanOQP8_Chr15g0565721 [Helianthus annuus]
MGDLKVILNNRSLRHLNRCYSESSERGVENMCERHRFKIDFFDFPTTDSNTMETIRRALHAVSCCQLELATIIQFMCFNYLIFCFLYERCGIHQGKVY